MIPVRFVYCTGIRREILRNVKLVGSWDTSGHYSGTWSAKPLPMLLAQLEDGCPSYIVTIEFDPAEIGREFHWGVRLDAPGHPDIWGIPTEVNDASSDQQHRTFVLEAAGGEQRFYLTHCRRFGAQKRFRDGQREPGIEFSVWAPNAMKVETVFGVYDDGLQDKNSGYISDDGYGIDP